MVSIDCGVCGWDMSIINTTHNHHIYKCSYKGCTTVMVRRGKLLEGEHWRTDKVELALLHAESLLMKSPRGTDRDLCYARICEAIVAIRGLSSYSPGTTEEDQDQGSDPQPTS